MVMQDYKALPPRAPRVPRTPRRHNCRRAEDVALRRLLIVGAWLLVVIFALHLGRVAGLLECTP
jgi:hypothetical protein